MKRAFVFLLVFITLFIKSSPFVNAEDERGSRFAVLDIDSGAELSNVNYFVLRPVMEYDDKEGVAVGTMFDGVVFSVSNAPKSGSSAEGVITSLFKEGTCIPAADTVAGEMKEDGLLGKESKYPVYATVPYVGAAFSTANEKREFCNYYIDTLCTVFDSKNYKNVALVGVYLSTDYDSDPTLRTFCIDTAKEKGLLTLVSTTVKGEIKNASVFSANKKAADQIALQEQGRGYTLNLGGVPDNDNTVPFDNLTADYNLLRNKKIGKADLLFTFKAYNDLYDCASAIEGVIPNEKARETYDLVKEIIDCAFDKDFVTNEEKPGAEGWLYYAGGAFAVLGTAGIIYLVYALIKKGKNDGQQKDRKAKA